MKHNFNLEEGNMENKLKVKVKITCNTCGCNMTSTKTIKVSANDKLSAKAEAQEKVNQWKQSLKGKNCKICKSILESLKS